MKALTHATERRAQERDFVGIIYSLLNGAGQVMFQENPITGLFFLAGIFVASDNLGVAALLGLIAATVAAIWMGVPFQTIRRGLYGYNGILVGLALAVFLRFDAWVAVYIVIGAAFSALLTAACNAWLAAHDQPVLTAPFVLATWVLLLAVFLFGRLEPAGLPSPAFPAVLGVLGVLPDAGAAGRGIMTGVGQVMLIGNVITGLLFVVGIAFSSLPAAMLALLGSLLGAVVGAGLGGPGEWVPAGLYGFNPALVAIALGSVFLQPSARSFLWAAAGAVLSTLVFAAMVSLLQPVGMPALTMPFVVTTWVFLLARKSLMKEQST